MKRNMKNNGLKNPPTFMNVLNAPRAPPLFMEGITSDKRTNKAVRIIPCPKPSTNSTSRIGSNEEKIVYATKVVSQLETIVFPRKFSPDTEALLQEHLGSTPFKKGFKLLNQ